VAGIARLVVCSGLLLAVLTAPVGLATLALLAATATAFVSSSVWLNGWDERRAHARRLVAYHAAGIARIAGDWGRRDDTGVREAGPAHPYALDAGVVGERSLFTLLDTSASGAGRRTLLGWLLDDATPIDRARGAVARRLATEHAWRAAFFAHGSAEHDDDPDLLARVAASVSAPPAWTAPLIWIARAGILAALIAAYRGAGIPAGITLALVLAPIAFLANRLAQRWMAGVADPDRLHARVARDRRLLSRIAQLPASDEPRLPTDEAAAASAALARCESICDGLRQRRNPVWSGLVGSLLLAEWWNLARLERWTRRHASELARWNELIARVDALSCLGTYISEQGGCWPEWTVDGAMLEARDLAHPLLIGRRRVGNDIAIEPRLMLVVTGANASGKSTFLRACALAVVLARCGLTVPAASLRLRPMRLATAMDARDDLTGGRSRFQAEVERLRQVLERARSPGDPVLIALDEVLSGTNSLERHRGTRAVALGLRDSAAAILISTHDLALASLEREEAPPVRVVHFADRAAEGASGGDLAFDYRLRPGVLTTTNALRIMRAAGLPVPSEDPR
jgi:hypothetical protein